MLHLKQPRPVQISCVMPCLDEAQTIGACVADCVDAIRELNIHGEVVVADNGSTDGSQRIAAHAGARVINVRRKGYGCALMGGIAAARGKYILIGDSDQSYDFKELPRFIEKLNQGYDVVIGCRMPRGGGRIERGAMPFLHRWLGNPLLSYLGRVLFKTHVVDFHCGLRAFKRRAMRRLGLRSTGMEFASEMILKSALAHLKITQVPVTLRRDGRTRTPHLRTWPDGWRHLRLMLLHAPKCLFLYPGLGILVLAMLLFIRVLTGPIQLGPALSGTYSLFVLCLVILIGLQSVLFGLFSLVFASVFGCLPATKLTHYMLSRNPFEKGVMGGVLLSLGGTGCLLAGLARLKAGVENPTQPDVVLVTLLGALALSLAVQSVFGGFLLAVAGMFGRQLRHASSGARARYRAYNPAGVMYEASETGEHLLYGAGGLPGLVAGSQDPSPAQVGTAASGLVGRQGER